MYIIFLVMHQKKINKIILFLKIIKFYILNHPYFFYSKIFFKNIINLKILYSIFFEFKIYSLGKFKSKLNPFIAHELEIMDDNKNNEIPYLQGLRYFLDEDTVFYLYNMKSNVIKLFLKSTIKCKVFIHNINDKATLDESQFFYNIKKSHFKNKIFISDIKLDQKHFQFLENTNYLFLKKNENKFFFKFYSYIYDLYGKINNTAKHCNFNYFLYSRHELLNNSNKKGVSGIGLLKSVDLYPFDLCYESVLDFVDEFVLGIDTSSLNTSYEKKINNFLKKTNYKKKIKLNFFNFFSETSNNCYIRGRWIADVNNKLANKTSNKYVMMVGADEMFESSKLNNVKKLLSKNIDEFVPNFYHFVYNLNYIRDPNFAAYNKFMRIFNKNIYVSAHDGMGFRKINNIRVNSCDVDFKIFHLGYIYNYKKKVLSHLNKFNGLFGNHLSVPNFYKDMRPIIVNKKVKEDLLDTLSNFKYLDGYKQVIKYTK
jgi:hypothetical protein